MYYYDVNTKNIHVPHQFGLLPHRDYKLLFVNYFKLSKIDFQKIFGSTPICYKKRYAEVHLSTYFDVAMIINLIHLHKRSG